MWRNRPSTRREIQPHRCKLLAVMAVMVPLFTASDLATADPMSLPTDDFYIRSTNRQGQFHAYHQILSEPQKGFIEAQYCDRTFWVAKDTVIWTQNEAEAGRKLVVEANDLNERRVLCEDPQTQVTLDDLGLNDLELARLRQAKDGVGGGNRLKIIGEAFKGFK